MYTLYRKGPKMTAEVLVEGEADHVILAQP